MMHDMLTFSRRPASPDILFAEDFDDPAMDDARVPEVSEESGEPEIIEPVFSETELNAVRQAAYDAGIQEGLRRAAQGAEQTVAASLAAIAEALADARAVIGGIATETAENIARVLLAALAAALPGFCARHGAAEVQALIAALLPSLDDEPRITIRVPPAIREELDSHIGRLAQEQDGSVTVVADGDLSSGDVRVEWRNGQLRRDTAAIFSEIEAVLNAQGLLGATPPTGEAKHAG